VGPIETLSNEHGLIRHYLNVLALAESKIQEGQHPPREFFDKAVEFARGFADRFHHFKEEHVMFVRLAQKRKGEIDGQLDTLRYQHERGRNLIGGIARAVEGYAAGDMMKTADLLENMAAYISLLRHHIHIEDHVFYPMALEELSAEEMAALGEEFRKERERQGGEIFEVCHKLIVDMSSMLTHL